MNRRPKNAAEREPAALRGGTAVYRRLKDLLLEGGFERSAWIPVDRIAGEFGVSRQPVMDAIRRLSVEGFVEIVPQVGSRMRVYSTTEMRDFFGLFAASEAYVARLAAERIGRDDVVNLRLISAQIAAIQRMSTSAIERGRLYRMLNRRLHNEIGNATGSAVISELAETLRDRADFFIASKHDATFAHRLDEAFAEHEAIIDAIESGNADAAAGAMGMHIDGVRISLFQEATDWDAEVRIPDDRVDAV